MLNLPEDLQEIAKHEPRFVDVDLAMRSTPEGEHPWWRGLTDTAECHNPEEVASAMRDKGLPQSEAEEGVVWLRPARDGESDSLTK
jgi:hypothetical protein